MQDILLDMLEAAVMLDIGALRQQGGPSDWHFEEAQRRLQAIRESNASEAIFFKMPETAKTFQTYAECIAVLAFMPGGIKIGGRRFVGTINEEEENRRKPGRYYSGDEQTPEGRYLTSGEAAAYLNVERERFYAEIWDSVTKYRLPDEKYTLFYRLSDIEKITTREEGEQTA